LQSFSAKRLVPTVVVVYGTLMPFTNSILAYIILGTSVNFLIFIGGIVIIVGVIVVSYARYKEQQLTVSTATAVENVPKEEQHQELQDEHHIDDNTTDHAHETVSQEHNDEDHNSGTSQPVVISITKQ